MKSILLVFILLFFHSFIFNSYSQGCSDAGFCSLSSFQAKHADSLDSKYKNQFRLGGAYGKSDHDIVIYSGFVEYHKDVDNTSSIDIRFTYLAQQNSFVTSYGPSDLYLNANWLIAKDLILTTGCKLALSEADDESDTGNLPMDFQHSLGTFDVILGLHYKYKGFQLFLAGQQPLNNNKNKFLSTDFPVDSEFRKYQSTNNYFRKGDVLFRVAYPFEITHGIVINPSLVPIYHLGDDQFTMDGNKINIIGSKGLTLNANLFIDLAVNKMNKFTLSFASPLVSRKARPDGLTRKYVVGLEYNLRF